MYTQAFVTEWVRCFAMVDPIVLASCVTRGSAAPASTDSAAPARVVEEVLYRSLVAAARCVLQPRDEPDKPTPYEVHILSRYVHSTKT